MTLEQSLSLQEIFNKQRASFYNSLPKTVTQRLASLKCLHDLLINNKSQLIETVCNDFGHRSQHETALEIYSILEEIRHARRHLKKWMKPQKVKNSFLFPFAHSILIPQALGIIGIISAWNGPLNLTICPLVGALAAGNRVMIKASELAPKTSTLLARLISQYFNDEEVVIINGDSQVGQLFSALPFDHLLFTGSSKIARSIMASASSNLTPLTLELGGKSPVIIGKDAPLESAIKKIIITKLFNAGQVCLAPDHIFIPKGKEKEFIAISKRIVSIHYPNILTNTDYTNIINAWHIKRLKRYLEDAAALGAEVIPLTDDDNAPNEHNRCAPFIVLNTNANMLLMQEEVFGPILPIISYEHIQEVIQHINARPKPLGLYYFGKDKIELDYVLQNTYSGGVTVNDIALHFCQPNLPFGGVGESGMGSYHGKFGFNTFSQLKPIFYQSRLNFISMIYPPYGKLINFVMKKLLR